MNKMKPKLAEAASPKVPTDLGKALAANPIAKTQWMDLTPIARRDFISWIESAKQSETRMRRVQVACSKLAAGQRRPCCYAVIPMGLYKSLGANPKAKAQWKDLTSMERRDLASWIDSAKPPEAQKRRIEAACVMLAAGKQGP